MEKTTCLIDIQKQIETLNNHIEEMCMAKNMQEFVTLCESVHFDLNKIIAINKEETKIEKIFIQIIRMKICIQSIYENKKRCLMPILKKCVQQRIC